MAARNLSPPNPPAPPTTPISSLVGDIPSPSTLTSNLLGNMSLPTTSMSTLLGGMVTSLTTPTSSLLSGISSSDIVLNLEPSVVENSSMLSGPSPLLSAVASSEGQSLLAEGVAGSIRHSFVSPSPTSAFCGQSLMSSCGANSMDSSGGVGGGDHKVDHGVDHRVDHGVDHRVNHVIESCGDHHRVNHGVDHSGDHHVVDHVDGHTLSTLPLTNVGCPDSALLTNLFQDHVTEGFIDFAEINGQQGVLTPVSTVFPHSVFSSSSPQYPNCSVNSTNYSLLRTPVYCSGAGDSNNVYADTDTSTVYSAGNAIEFPAGDEFNTPSHVYTDIVQELNVQDLECIGFQQIKAVEIQRTQNTVESNRLDVVWSTWAAELKDQLKSSNWKDMTIMGKTAYGLEGVGCHKMMLALCSPLINNWLLDMDSLDEEACIIFPDFTTKDIEEFLNVLYLKNTVPSQTFHSIKRCLCGENSFTKTPNSIVNPLKDKAQINPSTVPSRLISKDYESAVTVQKPDLNTVKEKREEMKIEDDLFRRSQVEIKMEEFVKFEQEDKMFCVQMKNVQNESKLNIEEQQQCEDKDDNFIDNHNPTLLDDLRTPLTSGNNHKRIGQSSECDNNHRRKHSKLIKDSNSDSGENELIDDIIKLNAGINDDLENTVDAIKDTFRAKSKSDTLSSKSGDGVQCDICQKWLKNTKVLNLHMKLHSEPKHICDIDGCGKKFYNGTNLKAHIEVIHLNKKDCPCDVCGKLFHSNSAMRAHRSCHVYEKMECNECETSFKTKKSLKSHMRSKHSEHSFICSICQKEMANDFTLKSHIKRVHNKEKKFMCNKCGKEFFDKQALENHSKVHEPSTGVECIQCEICNTVLKHHKSYRHHMTFKHGEGNNRKHVCHLCGKAFMFSYHLNRHMELHKRGGFLCPICSKGFPSEAKLDTHYSATHPSAPKKSVTPQIVPQNSASENSAHQSSASKNSAHQSSATQNSVHHMLQL